MSDPDCHRGCRLISKPKKPWVGMTATCEYCHAVFVVGEHAIVLIWDGYYSVMCPGCEHFTQFKEKKPFRINLRTMLNAFRKSDFCHVLIRMLLFFCVLIPCAYLAFLLIFEYLILFTRLIHQQFK